MPLTEEFDLSTDTEEGIDTGGSVIDGYYVVECVDVYEDTKNEGCMVLELHITEGPFQGSKQFFRLFHPSGAEDDKKIAKAWQRRKGIASRLGLVSKADVGQVAKPVDWTDAIGWKGIVHLKRNQNGYLDVDYMGIWPFGHHELAKICEKKDAPSWLKKYAQPAGGFAPSAGATVPATELRREPVGAGATAGRGDISPDDI